MLHRIMFELPIFSEATAIDAKRAMRKLKLTECAAEELQLHANGAHGYDQHASKWMQSSARTAHEITVQH